MAMFQPTQLPQASSVEDRVHMLELWINHASSVLANHDKQHTDIDNKLNNLDSRLNHTMTTLTTIQQTINNKHDNNNKFKKEIMESKAVQSIKELDNGKGYALWNRKFKNAVDQARPGMLDALDWLEKIGKRQKK